MRKAIVTADSESAIYVYLQVYINTEMSENLLIVIYPNATTKALIDSFLNPELE